MADKYIKLKDNSGNILYPQTKVDLVNGLQTELDSKQNNLPTTSISGKVLKSTSTAGTVEWGDAAATGVTSITAGTGLTGGTITSTGTIAVDTTTIATKTDLAGKQDTISDLSTIRSKANSALQEIKINSVTVPDANITLQTDLGSDSSNGATTAAIRSFVNSSISASAANYVTANTSGDSFATEAALIAGPYYYNGSSYTPKNNDYAMVQASETHDNKQARYLYTISGSTGTWNFQYAVGSAFTAAQQAALDSGITSTKVSTYDGYASTIAGKQDALTAGSNITISGNTISATDTTYTAGTGIEITSNEIGVDTDTVALKEDIPVGTLDVTFNGTATASTQNLTNVVVGTTTYTVPQGATYSAGNGLSLSNNTFAIDTSVVATQTDLSGKQATISDLSTIRSGAALGATALQSVPTASASTLGGIKVGSGLAIDANGVLSVNLPSASGQPF